jgi:uncharacterized protein with PIN domain
LSPKTLLCDEMLRRLGRWLRAAGYDTGLAEVGLPDRALLARAAFEQRLLLTRDRALAATAASPVLLLAGAALADQAAELKRTAGIDWLLAPFTRCLVDNTLLQAAGPAETDRLPETARNLAGPIRLCPACGRLYWPGSHVRRMQARLTEWAAGPSL